MNSRKEKGVEGVNSQPKVCSSRSSQDKSSVKDNELSVKIINFSADIGTTSDILEATNKQA